MSAFDGSGDPLARLGSRSPLSQDFDLNLAPIIDCFVVLIAFVMISTAFASIGILEVTMAAGGRTPTEASNGDVRLRVDLAANGAIGMELSGKETRGFIVPALPGGRRDDAELSRRLDEVKKNWPGLKQARLVADNTVAYKDVVSSIEVIRRTVPGVALDGF